MGQSHSSGIKINEGGSRLEQRKISDCTMGLTRRESREEAELGKESLRLSCRTNQVSSNAMGRFGKKTACERCCAMGRNSQALHPCVPSHWLGAAGQEHVPGLKAEADADGAAAGGCQGAALLAAEQRVSSCREIQAVHFVAAAVLPYAMRVFFFFSGSVQGAVTPGFLGAPLPMAVTYAGLTTFHQGA